MNKKRLIELIQQPEKINQKDVQELEDLVRDYPYFQNAYFLIAKGNKENKSLKTSASVQRAAVFAPDRTQLKKFLDGTLKVEAKEFAKSSSGEKNNLIISDPDIKETDQNPQEPVFTFNLKPTELISFDNVVVEKDSSESLINEIQANLRKLHSSREGLESAEKDFDKMQGKRNVSKPAKTKKEPVKTTGVKAAIKTKKSSEKPEKESKVVVKKTKAPKEAVEATQKPKLEKKTVEKPKTEKKSQVKSLPKEEQIKIIEQFIESSPQIPKVIHGTVPEGQHTDLTSQLKYDMEDFITENLAIIMEKQGKTEKAIEIYNKLIWKFPQKKAYFATQIEKLKK